MICAPFSAAALNVVDIERLVFASLDLGDCGFELVVLALPLLQERESNADHLGRLPICACRHLGIDKFLLLWSELDHEQTLDWVSITAPYKV
jgi:hypothetical protein